MLPAIEVTKVLTQLQVLLRSCNDVVKTKQIIKVIHPGLKLSHARIITILLFQNLFPCFLSFCSSERSIHTHFSNFNLFALILVCLLLPYNANCSRWKSFADGQGTSYSLENFRGLFT